MRKFSILPLPLRYSTTEREACTVTPVETYGLAMQPAELPGEQGRAAFSLVVAHAVAACRWWCTVLRAIHPVAAQL